MPFVNAVLSVYGVVTWSVATTKSVLSFIRTSIVPAPPVALVLYVTVTVPAVLVELEGDTEHDVTMPLHEVTVNVVRMFRLSAHCHVSFKPDWLTPTFTDAVQGTPGRMEPMLSLWSED